MVWGVMLTYVNMLTIVVLFSMNCFQGILSITVRIYVLYIRTVCEIDNMKNSGGEPLILSDGLFMCQSGYWIFRE